MDPITITFYVFGAITVLSALRVITARNPVHSALFLVLTFFSCGAIWLLLQAEFLAITLVLVYVGAVMVLFLFVVMMLDLQEEERRRLDRVALGLGGVAILGLAGILVRAMTSGTAKGVGTPTVEGSTAELGRILFRSYLLPFEIVSVLLLVAMVGVILLSKKELK